MHLENWIAAALIFVGLVVLGLGNLVASWFRRRTAKQPWVYHEAMDILNSNAKSGQWLSDRIDTAHVMRIVSGSLHPDVYDAPSAKLRQRLANESSFRIQVIAGPRVLVKGGRNDFFDLLTGPDTAPNRVQVKFMRRTPVQHFRVVDGRHVYVEDPHDPRTEQRSVHVMDFAFWKGWQYDRAFERQWQQYQEPIALSEVEKVELTPAAPGDGSGQGTAV